PTCTPFETQGPRTAAAVSGHSDTPPDRPGAGHSNRSFRIESPLHNPRRGCPGSPFVPPQSPSGDLPATLPGTPPQSPHRFSSSYPLVRGWPRQLLVPFVTPVEAMRRLSVATSARRIVGNPRP